MIKVSDEKFYPPLATNSNLGQKGGTKHPKSAQNSTKSDWAQIFRVVQAKQMIKVADEKFYPPLAKTRIFAKEEVKTPKISRKLNKVRMS